MAQEAPQDKYQASLPKFDRNHQGVYERGEIDMSDLDLSIPVTFQMTRAEAAQIAQTAQRRGLSLSDMVACLMAFGLTADTLSDDGSGAVEIINQSQRLDAMKMGESFTLSLSEIGDAAELPDDDDDLVDISFVVPGAQVDTFRQMSLRHGLEGFEAVARRLMALGVVVEMLANDDGEATIVNRTHTRTNAPIGNPIGVRPPMLVG